MNRFITILAWTPIVAVLAAFMLGLLFGLYRGLREDPLVVGGFLFLIWLLWGLTYLRHRKD